MICIFMEITTFEASEKYGISKGYLRLLLGKGQIKGRQAGINAARAIWLIDEKSLKQFLKKERRPGPKKKNG